MSKKRKRNIIYFIEALFSLIITIGLGLFVYNFVINGVRKNPQPEEVKMIEGTGFGTTPQEALKKFVYLNGNMKDSMTVTYEQLQNHSATNTNLSRRYNAYKRASKGLLSESPLLNVTMKSDIKSYTDNLSYPLYFTVPEKSIKVSEPIQYKQKTITNFQGRTKTYTTTKIYVSFKSIETSYQLQSTDASSNGDFNKIENTRNFTKIGFTMVEVSKNQWRVLNSDDITSIGCRFATWNVTTGDKDNLSQNVIKDTIKKPSN